MNVSTVTVSRRTARGKAARADKLRELSRDLARAEGPTWDSTEMLFPSESEAVREAARAVGVRAVQAAMWQQLARWLDTDEATVALLKQELSKSRARRVLPDLEIWELSTFD